MNIFAALQQKLINIIKETFPEVTNFSGINIEFPKDPTHGDFATNAAMVLKGQLQQNPKDIATKLIEKISKLDGITSATLAGPGFINFNVESHYWVDLVNYITANPTDFGSSNIGKNQKVNVEFVSANPTGPLHIGHARGAVYGDALCNVLMKCGYNVTKEYYINDAGTQIETLIKSAFVRYQQAMGQNEEILEGMYPGEYLVPVGQELKKAYGDKLLNIPKEEAYKTIRQFVVDSMMNLVKADLLQLNIKHDVYTSEKNDLQDKGLVDKGIEYLENKGLIYQGTLEAPKGKAPEDWEAKEMTLFRASDFGDDTDRAVRRSNGMHTYIAGDIAYHIHKFQRGFNDMILVLGADHSGYVKRMKAIVNAISDGKATIDIAINQLVNLYKNGEPYKMSKRAGNFITVQDVVNEVGKDILRFVMLTRKCDTVIDFDFEKVKEQSKDNPVFYVQYASARACSILRNAAELGLSVEQNVKNLYTPQDIILIKKLAEFPKIVEAVAVQHEPHRIIYFLHELANEFHSFWAKGSEDSNLRFIIEGSKDLTLARLALANAVKTTIRSGLELIGVAALEKM
jgi:arginyl-tRNA synthetase